MEKNDIEYMTSAYRMLFEIETTLKKGISRILLETYGVNWKSILKIKGNLYTLSYQRIIYYYERHHPLKNVFTPSELTELNQVTDIRNKICHMQKISQKEYDLLERCRSYVHKNLVSYRKIMKV